MDIRTQRTYKMLVDALVELLDEKSLESVSVSEICERSTVRRATFYRHFEDKYDFFRYYLNTITENLMAELEGEHDLDDLEEYARTMHRGLIDFVDHNAGIVRNNLGETALAGALDMAMDQIAKGIVERIETHCAAKGMELGGTAGFVGMFYSGGMVHTLRWWILEDRPIPADDLVDWSTDCLMKIVG